MEFKGFLISGTGFVTVWHWEGEVIEEVVAFWSAEIRARISWVTNRAGVKLAVVILIFFAYNQQQLNCFLSMHPKTPRIAPSHSLRAFIGTRTTEQS